MKKAITIILGSIFLCCTGTAMAEEATSPPDDISVERTAGRVLISYWRDDHVVALYIHQTVDANLIHAGEEVLAIFTDLDWRWATIAIWVDAGTNVVNMVHDRDQRLFYTCQNGDNPERCREMSRVVSAWRRFLNTDRRIREALAAPLYQRFMPPGR